MVSVADDGIIAAIHAYLTMCRNGNFGLVFGRGEILLTYMIFVYRWTSLVSRTSRKIEKGQIFFQRPQTRPQLHLLKFCNSLALCGPFDIRIQPIEAI